MWSMKILSLVLLTVQNCSQMLLMRHAVTTKSYATSTAVVMQECIKLVVSLLLMLKVDGHTPASAAKMLHAHIIVNRTEFAKMAVPGIIYVVQNNLLYVAMANLDAATGSVMYQMKILTTAIISVILLRRQLTSLQWLSLGVLFVGAACVKQSTAAAGAAAAAAAETATATATAAASSDIGAVGSAATQLELESHAQSPFVGFVAVVVACCLSGLAGVYLELMMKSAKNISLWVKNVQLALFGVVFGLVGTLADWQTISKQGFFHGYSPAVWMVVLDVSCGGLLVALVVKYADNISKGFATSISIVLSTTISAIFMRFQPSGLFMVGALLVLAATFLYAHPTAPPTKLKTSASPRVAPKSPGSHI